MVGTPTTILREGRQFEVDARKTVTDDLNIGSKDFVASGDFLPLMQSHFDQDLTTTQTSYGLIGQADPDSSVVDLDRIPGPIGVVIAAELKNDTANETTFARPRVGTTGKSTAETSVTDTSFRKGASGTVATVSQTGAQEIEIEGKVSAGTGSFRSMTIQVGIIL